MSDPNMSNEEIDDLLLQVEEIDKISMDLTKGVRISASFIFVRFLIFECYSII